MSSIKTCDPLEREKKVKLPHYHQPAPHGPLEEPNHHMVISGGSMGYTRPDGVHVLPISALKP